jgi:hypothetical protein
MRIRLPWQIKHPRWAAKQQLASPSRYYGDGGTIHHSTDLDVEVHQGQVIAVWFRCQQLAFQQRDVGPERARGMQHVSGAALTGVEVLDL